MAELRRDPVSGSWVVVGFARSKATDFNACPFCPGNERLTGTPIREFKDASGSWLVRCFPASNPAFMIEAAENKRAEGMYDKMGNVGAHEIVVENRSHTKTLSEFDDDEFVLLLDMYMERIVDLKKDPRFKHVQVFRNHGELTGSFIFHPHAHVLATAIVPDGTYLELTNSKDHYLKKERCLLCDISAQEIRQNKRVVALTENFLAFCPFAPRFPFEVWVLPRFHAHAFESLTDKPLQREFARLFLDVMKRIERVRSSYTIAFHTAPNRAVERTGERDLRTDEYVHWHVEITPRDTKSSRYKREDEFHIVSVTPEEAANILKSERL